MSKKTKPSANGRAKPKTEPDALTIWRAGFLAGASAYNYYLCLHSQNWKTFADAAIDDGIIDRLYEQKAFFNSAATLSKPRPKAKPQFVRSKHLFKVHNVFPSGYQGIESVGGVLELEIPPEAPGYMPGQRVLSASDMWEFVGADTEYPITR